MPKRMAWEVRFAVALVSASVALNALLYACYRDIHHILLWNLTSLAFLPVSVLVVTGFIDRLLAARDRAQRREKTGTLVGVFFSAVGMRLLDRCVALDPAPGPLREAFGSAAAWERYDPARAAAVLAAHGFDLAPAAAHLQDLHDLLREQRDFLVRLLENPILLEHESFTDLLRAVLHLAEELGYRPSFQDLPASDVRHLAGDLVRVYGQLAREWVAYLNELRHTYPYLFSLAVRTNPLAERPSAVVQ
jgi:hypothetical protein